MAHVQSGICTIPFLTPLFRSNKGKIRVNKGKIRKKEPKNVGKSRVPACGAGGIRIRVFVIVG